MSDETKTVFTLAEETLCFGAMHSGEVETLARAVISLTERNAELERMLREADAALVWSMEAAEDSTPALSTMETYQAARTRTAARSSSRNPAYDGPMGIFEDYEGCDTAARGETK